MHDFTQINLVNCQLGTSMITGNALEKCGANKESEDVLIENQITSLVSKVLPLIAGILICGLISLL